MSDTDTQLFRLLDPEGKEIMNGPMSMIMERLPDTTARNDAIDSMLRTAVDAVEAEEKLADARASAAQILSDGITRLSTRMDTYGAKRAEEAERKEQEQAQRCSEEEYSPPPSTATADQGVFPSGPPVITRNPDKPEGMPRPPVGAGFD
jgi:hypothetical protein